MKDTIKAKQAFKVMTSKRWIAFSNNPNSRLVVDGDDVVMSAELISYDEHIDNIDGNEAYHVCEIFTTANGNQYIYSRDEEDDIDYIVKVVK